MLPKSIDMGLRQSILQQIDAPAIGADIYSLATVLYPINRSITGPGLRASLEALQQVVPLEVHAVESGTPVLDWTIPKEWSIRDAYVKNAQGERVIDFRANNLHVMSYSEPVRTVMPLADLKSRTFTLPDQPDLIPYRTGYYAGSWAFCASQRALDALPEGNYQVVIESSLEDGVLNYGEFVHRGETEDEILLSAHSCHPSLANDNCSGMALLAHLAARISGLRTRYTYRFLWAPGTIGAIAWLSRHKADLSRIEHGLVLSCVGDAGGPTYKRTFHGNAVIDRAMTHAISQAFPDANIIDFFPYGYDERQFNSPGFRLPVGLFQRSQFASFPEYHTSADDLDFIAPEHLASSYRTIAAALDIVERDAQYLNTEPYGEPQLGRRGLYEKFGGGNAQEATMAALWVLNLSDGDHSLLDIAERAKLPFATIAEAADLLTRHDLLTRAGATAKRPAN